MLKLSTKILTALLMTSSFAHASPAQKIECSLQAPNLRIQITISQSGHDRFTALVQPAQSTKGILLSGLHYASKCNFGECVGAFEQLPTFYLSADTSNQSASPSSWKLSLNIPELGLNFENQNVECSELDSDSK